MLTKNRATDNTHRRVIRGSGDSWGERGIDEQNHNRRHKGSKTQDGAHEQEITKIKQEAQTQTETNTHELDIDKR